MLLILCLSGILSASAQAPAGNGSIRQLQIFQDSLRKTGYQIINNPSEAERYNACFTMIKTLRSALKVHNSFNFSFDSLKTISIASSPDRRFRIFSWHVMNTDGSYRYYGTIQINTGNRDLLMYPLIDHSFEIKNPQDTLLSNQSWYGCQYYKIIPVSYNSPNPCYILLGWKGNTPETTKKIVEVLQLRDNKAIFGKQIFDGEPESKNAYRRVFEYSRQVSMLLNYLPAQQLIVFDHLAPADSIQKNNFRFYGPDLSYDGYRIQKGRLKFVQDLDLKNQASEADKSYIDPKIKSKDIINKIER